MKSNSVLSRPAGGKAIYRRDVQKTDGRNLYLYGYSPHTLPIMEGEQPSKVSGSELRYHPLRDSWSVYAAGRNKRTFKPGAASNPLAPTLSKTLHTEIPFTDFEMCVFENRFPAFDALASQTASLNGTLISPAEGTCEVVVYSPETNGSLATLGQERRRLVLSAWIDRYEYLYTEDHEYVLPFENRGDEVGVTLHHPHGQIYALPFIPEPQQKAVAAFESGYNLAGELIDWKDGYWIEETGGVVAFAPPFARYPYEVWLAPLDPVSGPWEFSEEQSDGFAHLMGKITELYDRFFDQTTPYMFSLQAAPKNHFQHFQFTAQFYPLLRAPGRVKYFASLEQATGVYTVDVLPEDVATTLKSMKGTTP